MRSLHLLGIAAQAEGLRLKRVAGTQVRGLVLMVVAGLFGLVTLGLLHAAGWMWLARSYGGLNATLGLALADALIMGVLLLMARERKDPIAEEALLVRRESLAAISRGSVLQDALAAMPWQKPAMAIGGMLAERFLRRSSRR